MPAVRSRGFMGYLDERDVFGVKWLKTNMDIQGENIYADISSVNYVLFSYGMKLREEMFVLTNVSILPNFFYSNPVFTL